LNHGWKKRRQKALVLLFRMHSAGVIPYFLLTAQSVAQKEKFFACEDLAYFDMFDRFCGIGF